MATDTFLSEQIIQGEQALGENDESAWVDVIHKMDEVYADLLQYQVELEEKNAALEEAESFIRGILTSMSDALIVTDLNNKIRQCNHAFEVFTGLNEQQLIGTKLANVLSQESVAILSLFRNTITDNKIEEHEVTVIDDNGESTPLLIRCSPQIDHEGRLVGMVLIGRPIGELRQAYNDLHQAHIELKQTQKQLVHSEKMASLGRLVAGVAHELNNPISFLHNNMFIIEKYGKRLRSYIDAMHQNSVNDEFVALRKELKIDRVLDDIPSLVEAGIEGTERVSKIVQDLKRFSTEQRESISNFNLTTSVNKAVNWVVSTATRKKVTLNISAEDVLVSGYEGYIHQVVVNLIQNGLDAMENSPKPQFDIRCWLINDRANVEIRDYGSGIAEESLNGIFDAFYTTKEVGKGTGLGLYISYGLIVEQCGGQMSAHNHPDGGAVFSFSIPTNLEVVS